MTTLNPIQVVPLTQLDDGTIMITDTGVPLEAVVSGVSEQALDELRALALEVTPTPEGARVRLGSDHELARLLNIVHSAGGRLVSAGPVRESLEDLFVREVGESLRGATSASKP